MSLLRVFKASRCRALDSLCFNLISCHNVFVLIATKQSICKLWVLTPQYETKYTSPKSRYASDRGGGLTARNVRNCKAYSE